MRLLVLSALVAVNFAATCKETGEATNADNKGTCGTNRVADSAQANTAGAVKSNYDTKCCKAGPKSKCSALKDAGNCGDYKMYDEAKKDTEGYADGYAAACCKTRVCSNTDATALTAAGKTCQCPGGKKHTTGNNGANANCAVNQLCKAGTAGTDSSKNGGNAACKESCAARAAMAGSDQGTCGEDKKAKAATQTANADKNSYESTCCEAKTCADFATKTDYAAGTQYDSSKATSAATQSSGAKNYKTECDKDIDCTTSDGSAAAPATGCKCASGTSAAGGAAAAAKATCTSGQFCMKGADGTTDPDSKQGKAGTCPASTCNSKGAAAKVDGATAEAKAFKCADKREDDPAKKNTAFTKAATEYDADCCRATETCKTRATAAAADGATEAAKKYACKSGREADATKDGDAMSDDTKFDANCCKTTTTKTPESSASVASIVAALAAAALNL